MIPASGRFVDFHLPRLLPALLWSGALGALGAAAFLLVRSCGNDLGAVVRYAIYFAAHVMLPGAVALHLVRGRPLSWATLLALGVPTGFALEVASFMSLSWLGLKAWHVATPVLWLAFGAWRVVRCQHGLVRWQLGARHAGLAFALGTLFFCTVIAAVSQMFSESPLATGLPQRPIFHDWMFLVSRAAAIKQYWPLEDPSLAGTPLQYHYFMMVHAAAASLGAKIELTLVMLRLMIVPLGAVLVAQAYLLGRWLSRRAWGGVIAALLTVCASGVSFVPTYSQTQFLDLFVRWLYVSPTFFFGVIYFGALLLGIAQGGAAAKFRAREIAWLTLLTAAATGAKGTVPPVVLLALGLWAAWWCVRRREIPGRLILLGATMTAAFGAVYLLAMASWGSGEAKLEPFRIYYLSEFWQQHQIPITRALKRWLHAPDFGTWLGWLTCAVLVIAGTSGVRLLAIPYLFGGAPRERAPLVAWLGAAFFASWLLGSAVHLDSNGELYFILLMRLPLAVLAGAFAVQAWERLGRWRAVQRARARALAPPPRRGLAAPRWLQTAGVAAAVLGLALTLAVQTSLWIARSRPGFADWLRAGPRPAVNADLVPLYEAMLWVRQHTEPEAVLIANAFTPKNLKTGRGVLVDHTTAGVHYYYSAVSERRLWVEAPSYQTDTARCRHRMHIAERIFYRGLAPSAKLVGGQPCYLLLDRSVGDEAWVSLPEKHRVFSNTRFDIFRLPRNAPVVAAKSLAGVN